MLIRHTKNAREPERRLLLRKPLKLLARSETHVSRETFTAEPARREIPSASLVIPGRPKAEPEIQIAESALDSGFAALAAPRNDKSCSWARSDSSQALP